MAVKLKEESVILLLNRICLPSLETIKGTLMQI